ncbi:MAG: hypothetical protein ACUVTM_05595 [Candidatus Bathyarchaeia archaeon]
MRWGGGTLKDKFRNVLLESIDLGLLVLGEVARQALYSHIERRYQVKHEDLPDRLEVLHEVLEGVLGVGGRVVERLIARTMCESLNLRFIEHENWTLQEYVEYAKKLI